MPQPLEVAIIGGGITGITLAIGLLRRGVNFTIYERAGSFGEIGAGIGFTPNAERAMKALDRRIHESFKRVAVQNDTDWFNYVDGFSPGGGGGGEKEGHLCEDTDEKMIFKIYLGERGFEGCRRSDFLEEMASFIPHGNLVRFGKSLESVLDPPGGGKVHLFFEDGSTAQSDVVIGCDGIRSRLRSIVHPSPVCGQPSYTHKFAFRGLVPMDQAAAALGKEKTGTRMMHCGPGAHALTFAVGGNLMNVVAFVTDPNPWDHAAGSNDTASKSASDGQKSGPLSLRFTAPATKAEAMRAFASFGPAVRAIMSLLPDNLDKWAIFDLLDNPVPKYSKGRLCLAGDAAHASSPHHGAGAGCGIEDSLALADLLAAVDGKLDGLPSKSAELPLGQRVEAALSVYNDVRYERTQWLMKTSREVGELYEWQYKGCGNDPEMFGQEMTTRCRHIWDFDVNDMIKCALEGLKKTLQHS